MTTSMSPADGHAALAETIWNASRADEGSISATGANHVAAAILASDWLRARDTAARVETLHMAAEFLRSLDWEGWRPTDDVMLDRLAGDADALAEVLSIWRRNRPEGEQS